MKKLSTLIAAILICINLFAQAPQRLSYQAIIRNANNVLVTNAPIKMRISILQGSITGTAVYTELHSATTNANGVAFVEVGGGTSPTGNFASINWGQGPYFLRSETDPNNGTNYTIVGTTQLLSVPYALQSNRAARADSSTHAVRSSRSDSATAASRATLASRADSASRSGRADSAARAGRAERATVADNGLPPTSIHGELRLYQCNGIVQYTPCLPLVVTTPLSGITGFGAASGGTITSEGGVPVTARGVVWSTAVNPTISLTTRTSNGTGAGSYTSSLTNLTPNTLYYVRAYATNSAGTAYGNELSFRTGRLPVVTTTAISAITATTATGGGNVTDSGTARVTARGIVWSTSQNPSIALSTRTNNGTGLGSFTSSITGLSPDSTYFVRAYATSSVGTAYGTQVSFRALRLPVVTTTTISAITATTATGGGNVTDSGTSSVTARGIVWSTSQNPTIALSTRTNNGTGIGSFTSSLTGLTPNTLYYVRAYATSSAGTVYGSELTFRTVPLTLPTVSTNPVFSITETGAISGGNISNNGGATITARGIVWSTSPNPTINLNTQTSDGTGSGAFASTLSSLAPGTLYYVRAYATNSVGTAYGNQVSFTTTRSIPATINNGLVGYWPFNGNANDESGNGNNGTVNGATLTADRFGNNNKAYSFNGVNNYISLNNITSFNNAKNFSVSVWAKILNLNSANDGAQYIISRGRDIIPGSFLIAFGQQTSPYNNKFATGLNGNGGVIPPSITESIPQANWHHLTTTFDGSSIKFYIDGILVGTSSYTQELSISSDITLIGKHDVPGASYFVNGKIDDIRIYNRALTQEEITYLSNN